MPSEALKSTMSVEGAPLSDPPDGEGGMYESFYQLKEKPFSLLPDPDFLYLGGKYQSALSLLEYGVLNQAGFIVLTGEPGMGKTTLLRKLVELMKADFSVGLVTNTHRDFGSLLPWILAAFGLPSDNRDALRMFQELGEFLTHHTLRQRRVLLIVDEAQNLTAGMLEELRLLSNLNGQKVHTLQVLLCGQPDLRTLLKRSDLVQFAQRVSVDCHLVPLQEAETVEYIQHRLRVAGGEPILFTPQACIAAHRLTGGLPRLINQVCDMALSYGFADQISRIDARIVIEAVRDREAGGIMPVVATGNLPQEDESTTITATAEPPTPSVDRAAQPRPSVERVPPPKAVSVDVGVNDVIPPGISQVMRAQLSQPVVEPATIVPVDLAQIPRPAALSPKIELAAALVETRADVSARPAVSQSGEVKESGGETPASAGAPVGAALDRSDALYKDGVKLKKVGRYKDAIRTLEQAAQHSDYWMKAYAQVGVCFREAGRSTDAVAAFRKALAKAGDSPRSGLRVRYELAKTLHTLGKKTEAVELYRQIHQVDAGYLDVADRLGRLGVSVRPRGGISFPGGGAPTWVGRVWTHLQGFLRAR